MRSLIIGATGQIGTSLISLCEENCRTHLGTSYRTAHPDFSPLDLRDAETVEDIIAELEPEAVMLASGISDAAIAEANPEEAYEINVGGVANVARTLRRLGGRLVMFSPADVFGDSKTACREDDAVSPVNLLGQLAAEAEEIVRSELPGRHLILRSSMVYGSEMRPRGLMTRMLNHLTAGEPFSAATDRFLQPTFADDLAVAAFELTSRGYTGTFHVVGPERMSEFTLARLLAFVYRQDADLVSASSVAELDDASRRMSSWLDRFKLRSVLGPSAVRFTADGLRMMRDRMTVHAEADVRLRAA